MNTHNSSCDHILSSRICKYQYFYLSALTHIDTFEWDIYKILLASSINCNWLDHLFNFAPTKTWTKVKSFSDISIEFNFALLFNGFIFLEFKARLFRLYVQHWLGLPVLLKFDSINWTIFEITRCINFGRSSCRICVTNYAN